MKSIFIMTDLEGVAGVASFEDQTYPTGRYYDYAKKLLTAEINAAVEALVQQGVEDILIVDGHGPGAVWFEDLHPEAKLLHGRPTTQLIMKHGLENYDASAIIGQHAMAGVATSTLSHTQSSKSIDWVKLNGRPIGEIAQFALYAGDLGVPMIFLTGEKDACLEVEALIPEITTACVKQGLGRGSAISVSAKKSREIIHTQVTAAVKKHRQTPIKPLVWDGPFVLEKRYYSVSDADAASAQPHVTRVDGQTVRIKGDNVRNVVYA